MRTIYLAQCRVSAVFDIELKRRFFRDGPIACIDGQYDSPAIISISLISTKIMRTVYLGQRRSLAFMGLLIILLSHLITQNWWKKYRTP